jgi:hypothetical protein
MKLIIVVDLPDAAAHTAPAIEQRVSDCVRHFREVSCMDVNVHRMTLLSDDRYADNVKRLYGAEPKGHRAWVRRLAKGV